MVGTAGVALTQYTHRRGGVKIAKARMNAKRDVPLPYVRHLPLRYTHMRTLLLASTLLAASISQAQDHSDAERNLAGEALRNAPGVVSLGLRTSGSFFNGGDGANRSTGVGGQIRIRISERVNTDWFYDYFSGNIGDHARRTDQHIGWSVLFYLQDPSAKARLLQPYILAGHCFDGTFQVANNDPDNRAERWSSAVQAGIGTHINLSPRTDISVVSQYMIHLGSDVHTYQHSDGEVMFEQHSHASLEGHLLLHLSFNYKLFRAW